VTDEGRAWLTIHTVGAALGWGTTGTSYGARMKRTFLFLLGAAGGAALVWWGIAWGAMKGPPVMLHYTKLGPVSDQMGCNSVAIAMLNEEVDLGAPPNKYGGDVRVVGDRGTDTLSLKVDHSARKLLVLSGADVRIGRVEPEEMTIIRDDSNALVAIQTTASRADVFVLRINRQTGNAVWGKVGNLLGTQVGWVQYLECR
jgi:hypothetical protein